MVYLPTSAIAILLVIQSINSNIYNLSARILVLGMVVWTPWYFATVESRGYLIAYSLLLLLSIAYALDVVANSSRRWAGCPVGLLLAGLVLWTIVQVLPFPDGLLHALCRQRCELIDFLLPKIPEEIDGSSQSFNSTPNSIAIDTFRAREFIDKLLFVFILYCIVRTTIFSKIFLRWLAIGCIANASLLSIAGFAVNYSYSPNKILWLLPANGGSPFGAFVNRNHFAFYGNLCLGLGLSLLTAKSSERTKYAVRNRKSRTWQSRLLSSYTDLFAILQNPRSFWVLALGLAIVMGILFTQSRGAFFAAIVGVAVCLIRLSKLPTRDKKIPMSLLAPFVVGMLAAIWYSSTLFENKLKDFDSSSMHDDRTSLWMESIRLIPTFGLLGSGAGSFALVEPLARVSVSYVDPFVFDHAHNEYLEAIVEGGMPRLFITLALAGIVFAAAWRACAIHAKRSSANLCFGILYAVTTAIVHSIFEFGIHVGSIAVLLCVVSACAMALSRDTGREAAGPPATDPRLPSASTGRGTALLTAILFPFLAAILFWQAWKADSASTLRSYAEQERLYRKDERANSSMLFFGGAVVRELDRFNGENNASLQRRDEFSAGALAAQPDNPELLLLRGDCLADKFLSSELPEEEKVKAIHEALALWIDSRNLSPLQPQPHARLGIYASYLKRGDTAIEYFERAKRLLKFDSLIWYACGLYYYDAGEYEKAWAEWRMALELNSPYAAAILNRVKGKLSAAEIVDKLIPDRFDGAYESMNSLFSNAIVEAKDREPFLLKAAKLFEKSTDWKAKDLRRAGLIYRELGYWDKARDCYTKALAREPQSAAWRVEYAQLLRQSGPEKIPLGQQIANLQAARRELEKACRDDGKDENAAYWLSFVVRELDLRKERPAGD